MQPTTQTQASQEDSSENKENWIIPGFVWVPQCVIVWNIHTNWKTSLIFQKLRWPNTRTLLYHVCRPISIPFITLSSPRFYSSSSLGPRPEAPARAWPRHISTLPCLPFFSIHDYTIQLSVLTLMQFQTRSNQTYSFSSLSIVPSTFPSQISLLSTKHQINEPWQPWQPNPRTGSKQVLSTTTTTTTQRKPANQTGQTPSITGLFFYLSI